MKTRFLAASLLVCGALSSPGRAATWECAWPSNTAPKIQIAPLLWGKTWAYSLEIDDGPASTFTVVQPLLAKFAFSDAPVGVGGGKPKPFVGGAAIFMARFDSGNSTLLNAEQLRGLQQSGWELLNHSYWHSGRSWGDAAGQLGAADIRRELFWSQALMATLSPGNRAPAQFVFPNGYTPYAEHLGEFGIRGASRVGASSKRRIDEKTVWLDLDRNYLDEGTWAKSGDALQGLPPTPAQNDWIIDFTHGIDANVDSVNHRRWQTRLEHISSQWGKAGDDSLWCAPTGAVVAYAHAAKAAKLEVKAGKIRLEVPDGLPGTPMTLHFSDVDAALKIPIPAGATLYRKGREAWLTTPFLGELGAPAPSPRLERIYSGEVKAVTLEKPRRIAGVRLLQAGSAPKTFALQIDVVGTDSQVTPLVSPEKAALGSNWGTWLLFPTVPDREAPLAREVRVNADPSLKKMEIWAVAG